MRRGRPRGWSGAGRRQRGLRAARHLRRVYGARARDDRGDGGAADAPDRQRQRRRAGERGARPSTGTPSGARGLSSRSRARPRACWRRRAPASASRCRPTRRRCRRGWTAARPPRSRGKSCYGADDFVSVPDASWRRASGARRVGPADRRRRIRRRRTRRLGGGGRAAGVGEALDLGCSGSRSSCARARSRIDR